MFVVRLFVRYILLVLPQVLITNLASAPQSDPILCVAIPSNPSLVSLMILPALAGVPQVSVPTLPAVLTSLCSTELW